MTVCSQLSVCKTRPPLVAVAVTDKQYRSHNTHILKPWKIHRRAKRKLTTPSEKTEQVTSDIKKIKIPLNEYPFVALQCVVTDHCIASVQTHNPIVFSYALNARNDHE